MTEPDISCIPAVKSQIDQAVEKLQIAATVLRKAGFTENADEIIGKAKWFRTFSEPDGVLDWMQKPQPEDQDAG